MSVDAREFCELLSVHRLIPQPQIDRMASELGRNPPSVDSSDLARRLVDGGQLTQYQAQELLSGQGDRLRLGDYVLLDVLGEGGMGVVFRAMQERMRREVVFAAMADRVVNASRLGIVRGGRAVGVSVPEGRRDDRQSESDDRQHSPSSGSLGRPLEKGRPGQWQK